MVSPDSSSPKWSRRSPPPNTKRSAAWPFLGVACVSFVLGFAFDRLVLPPPAVPVSAKLPAPATAPPPDEESTRMVSLFYPLADGSGLSSIIQKRPDCPDDTSCQEDLLLALSENPGAGLFPLLPLTNVAPTVLIDGATATINFSRETIQHLPGGVQSERLVLSALVNTLAVNFPQVQQLSIEIDGVPAETLKGHIDLSTPFVADFSLVRRPLLPSFPVKSATPAERSL